MEAYVCVRWFSGRILIFLVDSGEACEESEEVHGVIWVE